MSEDLTNQLPQSDNEVLKLILKIVQGLDRRMTALEIRLTSLEVRFTSLEGCFGRFQAEMRRDIRDLNNTVGDLSRNQTVLNDTVRKMDHDFRDIFERLHIVEVTGNQQNSTT